jgi:hypothetical protein
VPLPQRWIACFPGIAKLHFRKSVRSVARLQSKREWFSERIKEKLALSDSSLDARRSIDSVVHGKETEESSYS